jgi:stage V sporulation protein D (sporulation-specific penicillin-binding protein)
LSVTNIVVRKRITTLFFIVASILILLIARLAWIQFVRGAELKAKAETNRMDDIPIPAKRGAIYDRNGEELVVSISSDSVYAIPPETKKGDREKTARELARILGMKYEDIYKKITKSSNFEYIKRKVDPEKSKEIKKLGLPGIDVVEESQRAYPKGKFASHILGFVGIDNIGLDGLEAKLNKDLAGIPGRIITEKDATGREIPQAVHEYEEPVPGNNIYLTLDETIQYFVERELDNIMAQHSPKGATIIVMDPKTGAILGMGNRPDFDPANYNKSPVESRRNLAVQLNYEPGSTFKVVTSAAALEEGVVKPETPFFDSGFIAVGDRKIKCWKYPRAHGALDFVGVVKQSCNPGFVKIGLDLAKERFYKYIRAFGFGQKTGISLSGEDNGILIPEKKVTPINLATISIGQSISVTPIQIITAISAVANDGMLMKPQLIKEVRDYKGTIINKIKLEPVRQVISKSTSRQLAGILEKVVSEGTGKNAYLEGFRIAGKTGTAQKAGVGGYTQGKYISSFAGFAPADDPQVALLVVIDEPQGDYYYGGTIAAPIFKNLAKDTLRYLNVTPILSEEELKNRSDNSEVLVPDIINTSLDDALRIMQEAGLETRVDGEGSWVINQQPKGGARFSAGNKVIVYVGNQSKGIPDGQEVTVPDLTGMTMRDAGQLLGRLGLQLNPMGSGIVSGQRMSPGTKVKVGVVVSVYFSPSVSEPSP